MAVEFGLTSPLHTERCPIQVYRPEADSSKMHQRDSLLPKAIPKLMLGAPAVYDVTGNTWIVKTNDHLLFARRDTEVIPIAEIEHTPNGIKIGEHNPDALEHIRGGHIVPVGAWGFEYDMMWTDWGKEIPSAIVDVPSNIIAQKQKEQARIMWQLLRDGPVYVGATHSAGCLEGKGLQSVLVPHVHLWQFSKALQELTPQIIKETRQNEIWDRGLSNIVGTRIAQRMEDEVLRDHWDRRTGELRQGYWLNSQVEPDNMGLTIALKNFSPDHYADPQFIDRFLRPLSHIIHSELIELHGKMFTSDLNTVINFVRAAHTTGDVNMDDYKAFQVGRTYRDQSDERVRKLQAIEEAGLLRFPVGGWAFGLQLKPGQAFMGVSFGFLNVDIGGVECVGVKLDRPREPTPQSIMAERNKRYNDTLIYALAA